MVDFRALDALGFEPETARERFLDKEEFYYACMMIYIRANDIARLTELCASGDWENAQKCVHMMKGSTGNLALSGMYAHYSAMTELFRSGESELAVSMLPKAQEMERRMRAAAGVPEGTEELQEF